MANRRKMNVFILAGGVLVIILIFVLFTPAILGSASVSGGDLEKYNGTSQQGNETARISGAINKFFVGMTGIPLTLVAYMVALFIVVLAMLWVLKRNKR